MRDSRAMQKDPYREKLTQGKALEEAGRKREELEKPGAVTKESLPKKKSTAPQRRKRAENLCPGCRKKALQQKRWQKGHREEWNAYMRAWRKKKREESGVKTDSVRGVNSAADPSKVVES